MSMLKKIVVVILAAVVTGGFWLGSQLTVQQKLKRVPVVIAVQDIPARTQITGDMVKEITLPGAGIPPGVARKKDEVVGKYTMSNYGIPQNGYFFTSVVKNAEELPDGALITLRPGEELVAMNIDLQKYLGGNAVPGALVNLWFSTKAGRNEQPVVGLFCKSVRVLGARDSKALETVNQNPSDAEKDKKTTPKPSVAKVLLLAMPEADVKYFFMAQAVGQVYPTGIQEGPQLEEGAAVAVDIAEARKWLEANVRVLSTD